MSNASPWIGACLAGITVGFLLGAVYFSSLRRTTLLLAEPARARRALGETILRLLVALAAFALLTRWGVVPAVAGLVGFSLAREWRLAGARGG